MSKVRIDTSECEEIARNLNAIAGSLSGTADNVSRSIRQIRGLIGLIGAITSWWKIKQISHKAKRASKCIYESIDYYTKAYEILSDIDWTAHNDFSLPPSGKPSNLIISNDMSDEDKRLRDDYIRKYELAFPDHADKMNNLFSEAPEEYADDVKNIKYIAYTSDGTCRNLFFEYVGDLRIIEYDAHDLKGNPANYFVHEDKGMHLNIPLMRNRNNRYGSFFHESGHDIDWLMRNQNSDDEKYFTSTFNGSSFHDTLYKEVEGNVRTLITDYSRNEKHLTIEEQNLILDVLMGRKGEDAVRNTKTDYAYRKVFEDITGQWKGIWSRQVMHGNDVGILEIGKNPEAGIVCEVFCGCTNNTLMADNTADPRTNLAAMNSFLFHPKDYSIEGRIIWKDPVEAIKYLTYSEDSLDVTLMHTGHPWDYLEKFGDTEHHYYYIDGKSTGCVESEFMAEYMRVNMTNQTKVIDYTKKYLGKSWDTLENGIKEHLNGLH